MRVLLLRFIRFLISLVNNYTYSDIYTDDFDPNTKIQDGYAFTETEYLIEAGEGFVPVSNIFKTQEYNIWRIKTVDGLVLECADQHNLFLESGERIFVEHLKRGDRVKTLNGISEVLYSVNTGRRDECFDFTVMSATHSYYTDGFLSHNTVTTGLFIAWYVTFNVERNVLVIANKYLTTREIIDKIKEILKHIPFYMKPGLVQNTEVQMKFDNGCRIMGQATTKTAAIGFTIHLAFMDEFAHIPPNIVEPYYRSIYPTLASSKISKMIITSTANGRNKFYEIYEGGLKGANEFKSMRIDWWQVPGRDEVWRKREIANLGSEDLFNQEYGNQFITGDRLLLSGLTMAFYQKLQKKFKHKEMPAFEKFDDLDYRELKWHPLFLPNRIRENVKDKFVMTIDISKGVGQDYSVINIFRLEVMSKTRIRRIPAERIEDESSMIRLRQIGLYRNNKVDIDDLVRIAQTLVFDVIGADNVKLGVEMNFDGKTFVKLFQDHEEYYDDIFVHTRHAAARGLEIGVHLHKQNKMLYARDMRKLMFEGRIVVEEHTTIEELGNFSLNNKGTYSSQTGNDDVAMSCLHCVPVMQSEHFMIMLQEWIEELPMNIQKYMSDRINDALDKIDGESEIDRLKTLSSYERKFEKELSKYDDFA